MTSKDPKALPEPEETALQGGQNTSEPVDLERASADIEQRPKEPQGDWLPPDEPPPPLDPIDPETERQVLKERVAELERELLERKLASFSFFQSIKGLWWWFVGSDVEETSDELLEGLQQWESREEDDKGKTVRFPGRKTVLFTLAAIRRYRQFTVAWMLIVGLPGLLVFLVSFWQSYLTQEQLRVQLDESSRARRAQVIGTLYDTIAGCDPVVCPSKITEQHRLLGFEGPNPPECKPTSCHVASLRAREEALTVYSELCTSEDRTMRLARVVLIRANLIRANLMRADLNGADLNGANLIRANLSGANLSRANLSRAFLFRAYLIDTDLNGADLSKAFLMDTDLSRANLSGANLSGARYDSATKWPTAFDPKAAGAIEVD